MERRRDIERNFVETVDFAIKERVNLFLISGDVFDWILPGNFERIFFARQLYRLKERGIRTYIIGGNHDIPKTIDETGSAIELFMHVGLARVFRDVSGIENDVVRLGNLDVCISGKSFNPFDEFANPLSDTEVPLEGKINILMIHASLHGLNVSSSIPDIDKQHPIGSDDIPAGLSYLALGHFHNYFVREYRGCIIGNPGSVERLSWAEVEDPKGFIFADISPENVSIDFIELDVRPMMIDEIDISRHEDAGDLNRVIIDHALRRADQTALYRLFIKGQISKDMYNKLRLSEVYRGISDLFFNVELRRDELEITGYGQVFRGKIESPIDAFRKHIEMLMESSDEEEKRRLSMVLQEGLRYFEEVSR